MNVVGRGGRARGPSEALRAAAAAAAAARALALTADNTQESYLANGERQLAVERLRIRLGEALKDVPKEVLSDVSGTINWRGPKSLRDLMAHWCEDGLDHRLIWRTLRQDLPMLKDAIEAWLAR